MIRNNHPMMCLELLTNICVSGLLLTSKDPATLLYDAFNIMGISGFLPRHTYNTQEKSPSTRHCHGDGGMTNKQS